MSKIQIAMQHNKAQTQSAPWLLLLCHVQCQTWWRVASNEQV